jgi:hypothetical protein
VIQRWIVSCGFHIGDFGILNAIVLLLTSTADVIGIMDLGKV